jgi:hypothetical protein
MAIYEARRGPDHPHTAHSLHGLALVLADQGDLDGARALHVRALAIRETHLGADHPDTVRSRQRLAAVVAEVDKQRNRYRGSPAPVTGMDGAPQLLWAVWPRGVIGPRDPSVIKVTT